MIQFSMFSYVASRRLVIHLCISTILFCCCLFLSDSFYSLSYSESFVNNFFVFSTTFFLLSSGENGIRTHAPLRTNGFQDRLVMTTSISLHFCRFISDKEYFNTLFYICQQFFSTFSIKIKISCFTSIPPVYYLSISLNYLLFFKYYSILLYQISYLPLL